MLSIIIPIYDPDGKLEKMTRYCLSRLMHNTANEWEIICLMNGNAPWRPEGRGIKVITMSDRVSVATVYNTGIAAAQGSHVCNMHNDCMVPGGWDIVMVAEADRGNIAFPRVNETEGNCLLRGIKHAPEWMPPSCCFVMTKRLWDDLGGYDERFEQLHWEDTDLFYRARKRSVRLIQCPVEVEHWRAMTRSLLPDSGEGSMIINKEKFKAKHSRDMRYGTLEYPILYNIEAPKQYIGEEVRTHVRNSA